MKVAIVSKADASGGGASRVAEELATRLCSKGYEAVHFTAWASSFNEHRQPIYGRPLVRKLISLSHKASRKIGFSESLPFDLPSVMRALAGFDIVHFHDTSSAFSPITLSHVARSKPLVWTFHDCSPFTGGCIYPQMAGCERYKIGCGKCPLTNEWPLDGRLDATAWSLKLRRSLHEMPNLRAVTPSAWMRDLAWDSGNLKRRPSVISNMVDGEALRPLDDRNAVRRRLGIAEGRLVLAASSGNIGDVRKGIKETLAVARSLVELDPLVILLGVPDVRLHEHADGVDFLSTGYVHDRSQLREWLGVSDAFLFTSKADNQPLSILEALACGTPIYGFDTGGAVEMVQSGVTGRLVGMGDTQTLADLISADRSSGKLEAMRSTSRAAAVSTFGPEPFITKHVELYETAIEEQAS